MRDVFDWSPFVFVPVTPGRSPQGEKCSRTKTRTIGKAGKVGGLVQRVEASGGKEN